MEQKIIELATQSTWEELYNEFIDAVANNKLPGVTLDDIRKIEQDFDLS